MRRVRVVTDSTADMEESEAERLGITVVPLNVHWNGDTYRDKVEITIDEFYRKLREEKGTPKTSQPAVGRFEEVYRKLLGEADAIVSVHLSGALSGTVNSAHTAALNVAADRIFVVDSLTIATPLGWLALRMARLAEAGASAEECAAVATQYNARNWLFCVFDTLEFMRRGGRIGRVQAFAGSLLAVKPIIRVVEGEIIPVDRVRTRSAAVRRTVELARSLGPMEQLSVLYADNPEPAEQMLPLLRDAYAGTDLGMGRIGSVIGTHVGPGAFGLCGVVAGEVAGAGR